jgi:hypothetical protein
MLPTTVDCGTAMFRQGAKWRRAMTQDLLDPLFVKDEDSIVDSRALLLKMISPFAVIRVESGQVEYKEAAEGLNAKHKILIYLLCRLAFALKSGSNSAEPATPKQIEADTDLPGGTVRPRLKLLLDDKIAVKSDDGYAVQTTGLKRALRDLEPVIPEA